MFGNRCLVRACGYDGFSFLQHGSSNPNSSAWPIANPVLTCAAPSSAGYPSNFVADPFLYLQVRVQFLSTVYYLAKVLTVYTGMVHQVA